MMIAECSQLALQSSFYYARTSRHESSPFVAQSRALSYILQYSIIYFLHHSKIIIPCLPREIFFSLISTGVHYYLYFRINHCEGLYVRNTL